MRRLVKYKTEAEDMFYNHHDYFSDKHIEYWTTICFHILHIIATRTPDKPEYRVNIDKETRSNQS